MGVLGRQVTYPTCVSLNFRLWALGPAWAFLTQLRITLVSLSAGLLEGETFGKVGVVQDRHHVRVGRARGDEGVVLLWVRVRARSLFLPPRCFCDPCGRCLTMRQKVPEMQSLNLPRKEALAS